MLGWSRQSQSSPNLLRQKQTNKKTVYRVLKRMKTGSDEIHHALLTKQECFFNICTLDQRTY